MQPVRRPSRQSQNSFDQIERRGVSLVELMVVISMLGTIFTLTGVTFHLLLRSEKVVSQSFVTERSISRLAVQFREDVHRSELGTVIDGSAGAASELALADAAGVRVRYIVTKDGLSRRLVENDAINAREDFQLPECRVRFKSDHEADLSVMSLVIERPSATTTRNSRAPRAMRPLVIQAYLNRRQTLMGDKTSAKVENTEKDTGATTEEQK